MQNINHSSITPLNCRINDEFDINYPPDQTKAMFVTTREVYTLQSSSCSETWCETPWKTVEETSYYPAAVETFTILGFFYYFLIRYFVVKHSFVARKFYEETGDFTFALANEAMVGYFYNYQGLLIGTIPKGKPDIFTLKYILNACGIYFEDVSSISNNTVRFEGAAIVITISYENSDPNNPTYSYHVSAIPDTAYKFVEAKYYGLTRALSNRHGLKLIYVQTGQIGKFDIESLMIQLTTSLGLLAVASLVIDMIMLQFMPMRRWYQKFKFSESKDLGNMSDDIRNGVDYRIMSDDSYNEMVLLDQERLRNSSDDFNLFNPFSDKNDCVYSFTIPHFEVDDNSNRKKLKSNIYF